MPATRPSELQSSMEASWRTVQKSGRPMPSAEDPVGKLEHLRPWLVLILVLVLVLVSVLVTNWLLKDRAVEQSLINSMSA